MLNWQRRSLPLSEARDRGNPGQITKGEKRARCSSGYRRHDPGDVGPPRDLADGVPVCDPAMFSPRSALQRCCVSALRILTDGAIRAPSRDRGAAGLTSHDHAPRWGPRISIAVTSWYGAGKTHLDLSSPVRSTRSSVPLLRPRASNAQRHSSPSYRSSVRRWPAVNHHDGRNPVRRAVSSPIGAPDAVRRDVGPPALAVRRVVSAGNTHRAPRPPRGPLPRLPGAGRDVWPPSRATPRIGRD